VTAPTTDRHWLADALCRTQQHDPDLWFADTTQDRALALHLCRNHCPVLQQCAAAQLAPAHGIFAGTAYAANGRRDNHSQRQSSLNCKTCHDRRAATIEPTSRWENCGTYKAYKQHRLRNQDPCLPCKKANSERDRARRDRERARAGKEKNPCGTLSGVRRHKAAGEERCDLCVAYQRHSSARANAARHANSTLYDQDMIEKVRDLVGRYSDPRIAAILGIHKRSVGRIRKRHNIPSNRELLAGRYRTPGQVAA
jgi:hypothetical protein